MPFAGVDAAFLDKIMLASSSADAQGHLLPDDLTPIYDTSSNFSTHTYDWTTGRWSAPLQQKQWWEGRRPPDFQRVDVYLDESWNQQTQQPYSVPFYPPRDTGMADHGLKTNPTINPANDPLPNHVPLPWRGQNPVERTVDAANYWWDLPSGNWLETAKLPSYGSEKCEKEFTAVCNTNGVFVYAPAELDFGATPTWIDTSQAPDSYLTKPSWLGWHWDAELAMAAGQAYYRVCDTAMLDLMPPSSTGIRFTWSNVLCGNSFRARPFLTHFEDLGPVVYHDDSNTVEPKLVAKSYQALDLFLAGSSALDAEPYKFNTDYNGTAHYTDYIYYGYNAYSLGVCTTPMNDDDTCTLSISPVPADIWAQDRTCAQSIPQGVPIIICRDTNGNIIPFSGPSVVPKLRYKTPAKYITTMDTPTGLLPNVPCNRATWSKRYGGRCAAPVVQYLAYDEAYYTSHAKTTYNIPEYGGCLDGGSMRFISQQAAAGNTAYWNNATVRSWFTPPMWPFTAWRAATTDTDSEGATLYDASVYTWKADDINTNQAALDGLFLYQKVFELPTTSMSSGEGVRLFGIVMLSKSLLGIVWSATCILSTTTQHAVQAPVS